MKVTICGGGNGAHTLAPVLMSNGPWEVSLYAPFGDEAANLRRGVEEHAGLEALMPEGSVKAMPSMIASTPGEAAAGADIVAIVTPAFAHEEILEAVAPHIDPHALVGVMPARGGFEYAASRILTKAGRPDVTVFGLQTLPWACRIREYGKQVQVLGQKEAVGVATVPSHQAPAVAERLGAMLGLNLFPVENMLAITLGNIGQIVHPGIMYGLLRDRPQATFSADEIPLFYQNVTPEIGELLENMSAEVQTLCRRLEAAYGPELDLGSVASLREWLLMSYGHVIDDSSTLDRCFSSNRAYAGLKLPVREVEPGIFAPDFTARYLTEDIPFGLVVTRAIAGMAGTATPAIDEVITGAGRWMGREYLVDGSLRGRDLGSARIPQHYDIETLDELVEVVLGTRQRAGVH